MVSLAPMGYSCPPTVAPIAPPHLAVSSHVMRSRDVNTQHQPAGSQYLAAHKQKRGFGAVKHVMAIPSTAVLNQDGVLEETDPHRLAQRRKQICFGKVTEGYANYTRKVKPDDRQEGNDMHPVTPRHNQVCSKRSWDCQVGKWRRSLHYWDTNPSPESMRLKPEQLAQQKTDVTQNSDIQAYSKSVSDRLSQVMPRLHQGQQYVVVDPVTVKVKYMVKGENMCHVLKTPVQTTFQTFSSSLETKSGPALSMYYIDVDGDQVDVDDDVSLRAFLDSVQVVPAHAKPPKLIVETLTEVLSILQAKLHIKEVAKICDKHQLQVPRRTGASPAGLLDAPAATPQRLPELLDVHESRTPACCGETPAMNTYKALMMTPDSECRKLVFEG